MGLADEIMAAGHAERVFEGHPALVKVRILDQFGRRRWHELWEGNPAIARMGDRGPSLSIKHGPGCRPAERQAGRLYLTREEKRVGEVVAEDGPFVMIEPSTGWKCYEFFEAVIEATPCVRFVQCPQEGSRQLPGVTRVRAPVRSACGILVAATACLGSGGWLPAAAASLGVPIVVATPRSTLAEIVEQLENLCQPSEAPGAVDATK